MRDVFERLGLCVLERGWLSSNNILFAATEAAPATLVDTGYAAHAAQTVALVRRALGGERLGRIVNTHLHSDHCGGNAALHAAWGCEVVVPAASFDAAHQWDEEALTYRLTGQRCDRFPVHAALAAGAEITLGPTRWRAISAPGHDDQALMLFEPQHRVLISGDALWQERVAIIFPELDHGPGFDAALQALDTIEALAPSVVIPGHGPPFTDVSAALASVRSRLRFFQREPQRHRQYAARALMVFRMLEFRRITRTQLIDWFAAAPIASRFGPPRQAAEQTLERLLADRVLVAEGEDIVLGADPAS